MNIKAKRRAKLLRDMVRDSQGNETVKSLQNKHGARVNDGLTSNTAYRFCGI